MAWTRNVNLDWNGIGAEAKGKGRPLLSSQIGIRRPGLPVNIGKVGVEGFV